MSASAATSPDAALLRCCATVKRQQAALDAMMAEAEADRSTVTPEREERFQATLDRWWRAFERGAVLPALTPEGLRAKALTLQIARRDHGGGKCPAIDRFVDSLVADLLTNILPAIRLPPSVGDLVAQGRRIATDIQATTGCLKPEHRSAAIGLVAAETVRRLIAVEPRCGLRIGSAAMLAYADALPAAWSAQP